MTNRVTPEQLRAEAIEALRGPGDRHKELQRAVRDVKAELRPLVLEAARMEVPQTEIAAVTGLSRNTVAAWLS
ncbi:hypothetical protein [Streptantibioticus rubrisoli]|uniref:Uncharacterized protein n=1 Tax=Streptantibioticus rubrisoli TaxID=1387313 RepID=A0ABT1PMW5_9ACTN|nr:hypothetical protein [Streptantibioticus rubrisoli]MCQ4046697.1 hypothetical protein [Streptantibioticus rubrisoli]